MAKLFIDESGNSGADLHDQNQPVLAYAGVWLTPEHEQQLAAFLAQLRQQFNLQGTGELKGKGLLKTSRGRQALRAVLEHLRVTRIPVHVVAVHKHSMAAGVLIEDCTDYVYNPAFDERWTWDTSLKEPLAEKILRAADPAQLEAAWRSRAGEDKDAFKAAYDALLLRLSLDLDQQLATLAAAMRRTDLDDLWETSEMSRRRGHGYSPNLSAFSSLVQGCDFQADSLGHDAVHVFHDEQSEFEDAFSEWFSVLVRMEPFEFTYPSGNKQRLPLRRLINLGFANSETEAGIRAADILASAFRVAVQEFTTSQGSKSADFLDELKAMCRTRALMGDSPFLIGPESWQLSLWTMLAPKETWV